jgi:hypothetical protein
MARPKGIKNKIKTKEFSISLKLGDKTYTSHGNTALDALISLPRPEKITGKGFLTITDGEKKKDMLFMPVRLKRLFYSPTFQAIQVKNLIIGMK